jgi:glucose/arabinose dehydrogenase
MKLHFNFCVSAALFVGLFNTAIAATCSTVLKSAYPAPIVSDGWEAQLIVQGLTAPRSILFDSNGGLLVVQQGAGIVHLDFTDNGSTCLEVSKKTYLINSTAVRISTIKFANMPSANLSS